MEGLIPTIVKIVALKTEMVKNFLNLFIMYFIFARELCKSIGIPISPQRPESQVLGGLFLYHPSALRPPRLAVFSEAGAPPLGKGRIDPSALRAPPLGKGRIDPSALRAPPLGKGRIIPSFTRRGG
jgi:hypothetical protein